MTDSVTAGYLLSNSRLLWVPMNSTVQTNNTNAIVVKGGTYKFYIGRIKQGNWTTIAKVRLVKIINLSNS